MRSLIPEKVNNGLDKIVGKCFEGNRIADRGMSILAIKFAMNKSEEILHEKLAHLFPKLADKISSYQGDRNNLTFYPETMSDNSDYSSPLEFFYKMLDYMQDLEALVSEIMDSSDEEDIVTYIFLQKFMLDLIPVTSQCLLLVDKGENYKDNWMVFDHNISDFVIL
jgi:ferritin